MRIFIDVGAHYGETLDVALNPKWGFDRVYSLEPSDAAFSVLSRFRDPRLIAQKIGLSNRTMTATLYASGTLGASIYADKKRKGDGGSVEQISLVKASEWFRENVPNGAEVYLKLNCEGGEADILDDLLDTDEISKVSKLWVDFDIGKVPSQAHRQAEIEQRLKQAGVDYRVAIGSGARRQRDMEEWLGFPGPRRAPLSRRVHHGLRLYAPPYERLKHVLAMILPRRAYWWVGRRFGRLSRGN